MYNVLCDDALTIGFCVDSSFSNQSTVEHCHLGFLELIVVQNTPHYRLSVLDSGGVTFQTVSLLPVLLDLLHLCLALSKTISSVSVLLNKQKYHSIRDLCIALAGLGAGVTPALHSVCTQRTQLWSTFCYATPTFSEDIASI